MIRSIRLIMVYGRTTPPVEVRVFRLGTVTRGVRLRFKSFLISKHVGYSSVGLECLIVIQEVTGSNPVSHPNWKSGQWWLSGLENRRV